MATESYVQPPENSPLGPKLQTLTKVIGSDTKHHYIVLAGKVTGIVTGSITRPADTNIYAPGDAYTNSTSAPVATTFSDVARDDGGSGAIVAAFASLSANEATKPQFQLWLFGGASAPTPDNDNAVFTPTDAEVLNVLGYIDFTDWKEGLAGASGNSVSPGLINGLVNGRIPYVTTSVNDIFGLVVVRNPYTPISGEVLSMRLHLEQD